MREVSRDTREQRCWFHKISNILAAVKKSTHPGRERRSRRSATPRTNATPSTRSRFEADYGAKFPKAVARITDHADTFCDYPAAHWVHLRTTNPVNRVDLRDRAQPEQDHQKDPARGRRESPWPTS
jgi:putative transposase